MNYNLIDLRLFFCLLGIELLKVRPLEEEFLRGSLGTGMVGEEEELDRVIMVSTEEEWDDIVRCS